MRRLKLFSIAAMVLLLSWSFGLAQGNDGYGDYPQEVQTTNSPAGTAQESGSQLLYLLDTGIDAVAEFGADPDFAGASLNTLSAGTIVGSRFVNFIAVTNTNPTDAVTVHFRYFNQHCEDVLDFLVVLTCNDTMLIDPFNFDIPGTSFNTSQRFFGDPDGQPALFSALPGVSYGSGRFLLFVTASGDAGNESRNALDTGSGVVDFDDPEDLDGKADWLFPNELVSDPGGLVNDCPAVITEKIGEDPGFNDNNLNIFNASAISFNYLTGFHTVGIPVGGFAATYGVAAWARPAVNASIDLDEVNSAQTHPAGTPGEAVNDPDPAMVGDERTIQDVDGDGDFDAFDMTAITDSGLDVDGPLAPKHVILSGTEQIWLTLVRNENLLLPMNQFYLRQDAHGGNSIETNCEGFTLLQPRCGGVSNPFVGAPVINGALAWVIFPDDIPDQSLYMLSVKDDYNGSNNPNNAFGGLDSDNSYRMDAAATYYQINVFNNNEELLQVIENRPPVSPPPPFDPISVTVAVKCIDAFTFDPGVAVSPQVGPSPNDFVFTSKLGDFGLDDAFALGDGAVGAFLSSPVPGFDEIGPGWFRLDRILTRDFFYDFNKPQFSVAIPYDGERGSYVTIAKQIVLFQAFGVAWYAPQSATDFNPILVLP